VCDLETSRIGAPYIYIYIYIYDISSLRVNFVQRYDVTWIGVTKETFGDGTGSEWNMREAD